MCITSRIRKSSTKDANALLQCGIYGSPVICIFKFCLKFPERYSIYSYLIQAAILLGFVIFEMILWGSNKYIEDVDNKEKQSIQDFKELIKDLEICRVNVQDTANKANIDKLYERMRYEIR